MASLKAGSPPDDSTLIFAGAADINDDNMRALLEQWLPEEIDLKPPVVQKTIPRAAKGLKKVLAWLTEQFPADDSLDRPADLTAYIGDLASTENVYLVVLWGDGDDEKTEALVDAASRREIPVYDLTDGLDQLQLGDNQPQPPAATTEPEQARRVRRGRATRDQEPAAEDEKPPFDVDEPAATPAAAATGPDVRIPLSALAGAFRAMADVLDHYAHDGGARVIAKPETTRTWLQNPENSDEYVLKGRGRPRTAMRNWKEVQFTPAQERELGLADS